MSEVSINAISGSIAGSGGILFLLLIALNILLLEIKDDAITFGLIFLFLIPVYILILPLISLVATLIDNSHPGKLKESIVHSCIHSIIGSVIFTVFLVLTVFLSTSDDGWQLFTDELGVGFLDMLFLVIFSNLSSALIGGTINGYRKPAGTLTSLDLDAYELAPSTIVEIIRNDSPREYYNSMISKGTSTGESLRNTMEKYPEWNPMVEK